VGLGIHHEDTKCTKGAAIFVIFPLACIWFAVEMGSYIGPTSSGAITSSTPGWLVCIGGWLLLLLPVLFAIGYAIWG
jgi:hypothetical protein